jgi:4-hydroxy-2-oxoheptanedioate aldolase
MTVCIVVEAKDAEAVRRISAKMCIDGAVALHFEDHEAAGRDGVISRSQLDGIAAEIKKIQERGRAAGILTDDEYLERRYLRMGAVRIPVTLDDVLTMAVFTAFLTRTFGGARK